SDQGKKKDDDEEARIGGGHGQSAQGLDMPQTFDEGDNLAGGGQDEDISGVEERNFRVTSDRALVPVTIEEPESDGSSDVTGGPSPPGSPLQGSHDQLPPGNLKRNPALEGITDVYYHHPERRLSSASSASARKSSVGAGGGPPRSLPAQGSRANLLRDQDYSSQPWERQASSNG
ncbi:hypothetical protein BGZ74_002808, partial [Mortierella antarctica]